MPSTRLNKLYPKQEQERKRLLEQFQDGEDDVVDVAKARRFRLLGVMQAARPVDRDVRHLLVQLHRRR